MNTVNLLTRQMKGYVFDSAASISPYLEDPLTGPTSKFCQELAERLKCYVVAGYPERLSPSEAEAHVRIATTNVLSREMEIPPASSAVEASKSAGPQEEPQARIQVGANSLALYGPTGKWVGGYRKTNLYETDMTWAKPGVC